MTLRLKIKFARASIPQCVLQVTYHSYLLSVCELTDDQGTYFIKFPTLFEVLQHPVYVIHILSNLLVCTRDKAHPD